MKRMKRFFNNLNKKDLLIYTFISTILMLSLSIFFRLFFNLRHFPIYFEHLYWGIILILFASVMLYLQDKFEKKIGSKLIGIGLGLVLSDLIHHAIFKIPFTLG